MLDIRRLDRMESIVVRQTFYGGDVPTALHQCKRKTGVDSPPVDQHGTGAAFTAIAALLGPGQAEVFAERSSSVVRRIHCERVLGAVDAERKSDAAAQWFVEESLVSGNVRLSLSSQLVLGRLYATRTSSL